MGRAKTIQIYLPSGDPAGLRVANLTTRAVQIFDIPRQLLPEFLKQPEAERVGVYYLFGSNEDEVPQCYIGQSGNVGKRLKQHTEEKDFWTKAMVAVSLTNEWTVTHAAYLEWMSIGQAKRASRYRVINGNQATNPHTPKPLEADCQEFMETIAVLMATLGAPVLDPLKSGQIDEGGGGSDVLFLNHSGSNARGYLTPEGMLVLAGSRGRMVLTKSASPRIGKHRDALIAEGVIAAEGDELVFQNDHLFASPSAAGCVLVGRSTNGRTGWKNAKGQSINDLEQLALPAAADEEQS